MLSRPRDQDHRLPAVAGRVGDLALGRGVEHGLGAAHDALVPVVDVLELVSAGSGGGSAFEKLPILRAPMT